MSEHFEGIVELIDQKLQDNKQGKAMTVYLKMPITRNQADKNLQKELIDFMGENVKCSLSVESNKRLSSVLEGEYWSRVKKLKKQSILIMEITVPYDKPLRKKLVDLEFHELSIEMDKVQRGLDGIESFEEDKED